MTRRVFQMICLLGLSSIALLHLSEIWFSGPTRPTAFLIEWLPLYAVWSIQLAISWWQPNQRDA
ncbi:hypothetical protein [Photobacterium galatheae]|uniref:Uncharacterized protein n=1 Tax=Photobacterium galatheae TaxID=1654360 RepID=A0A066RV65_9GAMM|nr:hypothetical protein [Photobacterium galatheae]KDM93006.1 hypothetical protein EA58_02125 [Photobacterium galatheae]MCM0148466.1 hypothetical protein [Photobacterium galatheae]